MLITTLCVLAQCVCAGEFLRGSGEANTYPSPTGKDTLEWSYIYYVVLGASAYVGTTIVTHKRQRRSRSSSSSEEVTWGIDEIPVRFASIEQSRGVVW